MYFSAKLICIVYGERSDNESSGKTGIFSLQYSEGYTSVLGSDTFLKIQPQGTLAGSNDGQKSS
jgi:hypothetical protein